MKSSRIRASVAAAICAAPLAAAVLIAAPFEQAQRAPRPAAQRAAYFPPRGEWASRDAAALGFDKTKLDAAVAYAKANENPNDKDLSKDILRTFRREAPYNELIGPTAVRGGASGLVIRRGYVAAEWGDTLRPDMTFSVTKTFLSTVVGLAHDRGMIRNVDDRVAPYMPANIDLFAPEKNAPITWDHLLRQTSDWQGTLYGKPDWADRPEGQTPAESEQRNCIHRETATSTTTCA